MNSLHRLGEYDSDEKEDADSTSSGTTLHGCLPSAALLLSGGFSRGSMTEDVCRGPWDEVRRNGIWPTLVYLPIEHNTELEDLRAESIERFKEAMDRSTPGPVDLHQTTKRRKRHRIKADEGAKRVREIYTEGGKKTWHISLSHTATLRCHEVDPVVEILRSDLQGVNPFVCGVSGRFDVLVNAAADKSFCCMRVIEGIDSIRRIISRVDHVLSRFRQKQFYVSPHHHISIAWVDGDVRKRLSGVLKQQQDVQEHEDIALVDVKQVMVTSGDRTFQIPLSNNNKVPISCCK